MHELALQGWLVTILAERFEQPVPNRVHLAAFFQRAPRHWLGKASDLLKIWRLVARSPGALVVVQGDLPRLTYVLLQWFAPLIFIRQDAILTCPANNRFLTQSKGVCPRPAGPGCLLTHRRERCFSQLPFLNQLARLAFRLRDRLLLRCLRHFVCNSRYIARIHRRSARVLYPPRTSPAGTSPSAPPPPARDLSRLIFCARLEPVKGAADALGILTLLPSRYHLEVLGDGPDLARLLALADRLQLRCRVTFHGWVKPAHRDRCLASAGALLIPSRWDEAFAMVGPESLAQGTPVVAYDVGGISEWCRDGAGILVPCGDLAGAAAAVRHLTSRPARWRAYSETAQRLVATEFPSERFARDLRDLVARLTAGKPARPCRPRAPVPSRGVDL
jgi:glycosyltransferase involved in cell wall biosynthesis